MEPTQKLVLYCPPGWGGVFMDLAKYQYGAQYPDVEVEYRTFTQGGESWITNAHGARGPNPEMTEDFNQALLAELNAGKGPDAVVFFSDTFPDLDKVLEAGVFCDLEPLFEQDETFDRAEYLTALLDAGRCQGKQLCLPLWFSDMYVIAQSDTLEAAGIHLSERPGFEEWADEIRRYLDTHTEQQNRLVFPDRPPRFDIFVIYSGLRMVDYTSKEILVDTEEFRRFMEFWKAVHPYSLDTLDLWSPDYDQPSEYQKLKDGTMLFDFVLRDEYITKVYQDPWRDSPDLLFPFPQIGGDYVPGWCGIYAAINRGSPNKQNAYQFLKILLSYPIQSHLGFGPVRCVPHGASPKLLEIVYEQMLPYFEGRRSFEQCRDALHDRLELYVQE